MLRVLVPILDSVNSRAAVRYVVGEFVRGERMEVHLLHVRTPLLRNAARWLSPKDDVAVHREAAEKRLRPLVKLLDAAHIRHTLHVELGDKAEVIVATAHRLQIDRIVLGAARDNSVTRWVEESVIEKVVDRSPVHVSVIASKSASPIEQVTVAAGITSVLGLLWLS